MKEKDRQERKGNTWKYKENKGKEREGKERKSTTR